MSVPNDAQSANRSGRAVLELATRDAMAAVRHVSGLIARRAYPLLGLACLPGAGQGGRLVVAVADDGRVKRLLAELSRLPEVVAARRSEATGLELAVLTD